jgi:hypothetical protein
MTEHNGTQRTLGVPTVLWQAVIAAVVTIVLAVVPLLVAKNTNAKIAEIAVVADQTHILVNSNMERQLRVSAIALRRVAELTKDKADIEAAHEATLLLTEHMKRQATIDAGSGAR